MKGFLLQQRVCNTIQAFILPPVPCTDQLDGLYDAEDNRTAVELSIYSNQAKL